MTFVQRSAEAPAPNPLAAAAADVAAAARPAHRRARVTPARPRRRMLAALALALAAAGCETAAPVQPAPPGVTMELSGRANAPLLVVLHGPEGSAARLRHLAAFGLGAEGWSIAWPDAGPRGWMEPGEADRLAGLIGRLAASGLVDPARVVVAGFSDGAQLALQLACERPRLVAGAAAVMASLPEGAACDAAPPVPVLMMQATTDPVLPYAGGSVARPAGLPAGLRLAGPVMAAEATAALVAHRNRCGAARRVEIPDLVPADGSRTVERVYEGCAAPVVQFVIEGGGHAWPGTRLATGVEAALGTPARDLSATLEIEAFARENVAPAAGATTGG